MKKYYIGVLLLAVLTLGLTGYVVYLGNEGKQDKITAEKAQEAADKLNNYVSEERKIPESLSEAGADDVPGTIKYERISDSEYKFCVTYKTDKGYGGGDITTVVTGAALSGMQGSSYYDYDTDEESSYLYLDYSYSKGETCKTIKPRNLGSSSPNTIDPSDSYMDFYCATEALREQYYYLCGDAEGNDSGMEDDTFGTDQL